MLSDMKLLPSRGLLCGFSSLTSFHFLFRAGSIRKHSEAIFVKKKKSMYVRVYGGLQVICIFFLHLSVLKEFL